MERRTAAAHSTVFSRMRSHGLANRSAPAIRPLFQNTNVWVQKRRGHSSRSWIRIDADGNSETLEIDKYTLMRRCNLPARDLRLLDPLFVYPSTILGREEAIVVNLEQIRCLILADEVFIMKSLDASVVQYESELCKRLIARRELNDDLPFEFRALEIALELTCVFLEAKATELEIEIYPVLDGLASSISTANLERARKLKSDLLTLTLRVEKIRDGIEHLLEDDSDMAEMYLTEKKQQAEAKAKLLNSESLLGYFSAQQGTSHSAPVSPTYSPTDSYKLERLSSFTNHSKRGSSKKSTTTSVEHISELEMLLEAYFVVIDSTFSKLSTLKEYIDDTEVFINIKLDNVRNQLIQFELLITAATFSVAIFTVVAGVFGMNYEIDLFNYASGFDWVVSISTVVSVLVFLSFVWYFKQKKLLFM